MEQLSTASAPRVQPRPGYLALYLTAVQRGIAYRRTTLLTLVANLVWVIVPYFLWRDVFRSSAAVGSFDWSQMQTYIILAFALNSLLLFYTEIEMFNAIRFGQIAVHLMRPLSYLGTRLFDSLGAATIEGLLSIPFAAILAIFFIQFDAPSSGLAVIAFGASAVLGFVVKFLLSFITGLLCIWTMNAVGLLWARAAVTSILSGAIVPLQFLPAPLGTFALHSPFQAIIHTPIAIYLEQISGLAVFRALGVQAIWVVALFLIAHALWVPSLKSLNIQGG